MAGSLLHSGSCAILALSAALSSLALVGALLDSRCPTGFANFGDSLTDTGNAVDAFPFVTDAENSPYGNTFFGAPARRFSDGRLVPDFFSLAFDVSLLDPYFATTAFDYHRGVNFAVGGATAAPTPIALVPFSSGIQVNQFIRFKNDLQSTTSQLACANFFPDLPSTTAFPGWLYTLEFGGNDILTALQNGTAPATIISTVIPAATASIATAIQTLYTQSARKFLVFGVPAQGCSTVILTILGSSGLPTDSLNCIILVNQLIQGLNTAVLTAIQNLRVSLAGASIAYFDYYSANVEILQNPLTYGFNPTTTLRACCGAPGVGSLNYNPAITCGNPGSNVCANPNQYVIWDGVHFTEQFYRTISKFALSARFTDHGTNYTALCGLDFSNFGSLVTYQHVYGLTTCKTVFS